MEKPDIVVGTPSVLLGHVQAKVSAILIEKSSPDVNWKLNFSLVGLSLLLTKG